jgi:hypothetical protein
MSAALITIEVKAVLRDLAELGALGVRVAIVQSTEDRGVCVGVEGDPDTAEAELRRRYSFPVGCWRFE